MSLSLTDLISQTQAVGIVLADEMEKSGQLISPLYSEAGYIALTLQNEIIDNDAEYNRVQKAYDDDFTMLEPSNLIEFFFWFRIFCLGNGYQQNYLSEMAKLGKRSPLFKFYLAIIKARIESLDKYIAESEKENPA